ncbi:nitroreductase family deazaflavin-dependent oxidoreductase [Agromyces sp. ZXT2-6]|uniref:nitroreductase family deazaflavin-dependent oxidoreductase n=1 Tax=Agromyces sp. ZXT2-6 TaxID=3461153 RepID=UPI0040552401
MTKPGPLLAWFYRAPSVLYRARLGWLLGGRFLMLTAVGRTTGEPRRTVVEVARRAGRDPGSPPVLWVVASRGPRTDWYRNAVTNPRVRVDWRSRRYAANARPLDEDERVELLADYQRRHPRAAAMLGSAALDASFTADHDALRRLAHELRALRLDPASTDVAPPR